MIRALMATLLLPGALAAQEIPVEAPPPPDEDRYDFDIDPEMLLQVRLTRDSVEDETHLFLPRARIGLDAEIDKILNAELVVDFGDFEISLKDAYVNVRAYKKHLQIQVGHFKRPYSRERLNSSSWVGAVDRSIIRSAFDQGRDLGLMLHNGITDRDGLEWAVGLFSDTVLEDIDPDIGATNLRPTLAARIGYHTEGLDGYKETDRERGPLRAGAGASVVVFFEDSESAPGRRGWRWNVDGIMKAHGFTLTATLLGSLGALDATEHEALGVYGHAGYRLAPLPELEFSVRHAALIPRDEDNHYEVTGAVSTYLFDDHVIVQLDGSWLRRPEPDDEDDGWRIRMQIQLK